jgi:hypothetical protein
MAEQNLLCMNLVAIFSPQIDNLYLLIGVFIAFTFNVITNMFLL